MSSVMQEEKNGNAGDLRSEFRAWAEEKLGVSARTKPAEIRSSFLRSIPDRNYLPPIESRRALEVLSDMSNQRRVEYVVEHHRDVLLETMREVVDRFTDAFFSIDPEERARRLNELKARCGVFPELSERLIRLDKGLEIDELPSANGASTIDRLACEVLVQFVLPPHKAAARRQRISNQWNDVPPTKKWSIWPGNSSRKIIRELKMRHPRIAELDPELVEMILNSSNNRGNTRSARAISVHGDEVEENTGFRFKVLALPDVVLDHIFRKLNSAGGPHEMEELKAKAFFTIVMVMIVLFVVILLQVPPVKKAPLNSSFANINNDQGTLFWNLHQESELVNSYKRLKTDTSEFEKWIRNNIDEKGDQYLAFIDFYLKSRRSRHQTEIAEALERSLGKLKEDRCLEEYSD